jgi:hypothetical protein
MGNDKKANGTLGLFVYRGFSQNSLQATVERAPKAPPIEIPKSGTSAPLGTPTIQPKKMKLKFNIGR